MMAKPMSGMMFIVPGILFIILGVAVVIEPRILVWLVAFALVMMGIGILMMASFMRRIGQRHHG
jgi:uncharacterized membrane protein HdeD (DUF308 family)